MNTPSRRERVTPDLPPPRDMPRLPDPDPEQVLDEAVPGAGSEQTPSEETPSEEAPSEEAPSEESGRKGPAPRDPAAEDVIPDEQAPEPPD